MYVHIVKIDGFFWQIKKNGDRLQKTDIVQSTNANVFPVAKKAEITTKFYESATESSTLQLGHYLTMPLEFFFLFFGGYFFSYTRLLENLENSWALLVFTVVLKKVHFGF